MIRLRKALLCNYLYIIILIIVILTTIIRLNLPKKSIYNEKSTNFIGVVININKSNETIKVEVKNKEKIIAYLNKDYNLCLGDKVNLKGEFTKPNTNTTKYLFNYQKYLKRKNIFYIVYVDYIEVIHHNKNIYYKVKQILINNLDNDPYLNTFILGNKSLINKDVQISYQENGISHLFAISGMHITLLSTIIEKILRKKLSEEKSFKITSVILFIYLFIVGFSPSILRGVLFFVLFKINNIYYFYIKPVDLFILVLSISLLINPNYIFDVAFLYSYTISLTLILMSDSLKDNNYFKSLLKVSLISFVSSIPISLYNFYQINLLSIIYNLFYVPFISFILYPLSLIVLIIKPLRPLFRFLSKLLETSSLFLSRFSLFKLVFMRINICIYLIYFLIVLSFIIIKNKKILLLLFSLLFLHYLIPKLDNTPYIKVLDVGQGDCLLIHLNNQNILLDTGTSTKKGSLTNNTIIPILRGSGIKKINTLILTHGDKDHLGEAEYLIEKIKVDKVIFNIGNYNYLEKTLQEKLNENHIKYYQNISNLNIKDTTLYFLNTFEYDNENDNSTVLYFEIFNHKFLLMGDASTKKELDILEEYELNNIDFLKVGHHGSNTSSSPYFIENIKPKNCLISVGENNRYKHPKESVIDILSNYCEIYRTDKNGSIEIKIRKNDYEIRTYNP